MHYSYSTVRSKRETHFHLLKTKQHPCVSILFDIFPLFFCGLGVVHWCTKQKIDWRATI